MSNDSLDEREFELINILGPEVTANQRDLSHEMNLSLGMINMLIRRLVTKGYIRTTQLNQRKVQYIITPKGFAEKMRKSVKYTLKTIDSISILKKGIMNIIHRFHKEGERNFTILGKSDFAVLVENAIREIYVTDYNIQRLKELNHNKIDGVLLVCQENFDSNTLQAGKCVNLIEELARERTHQDISKNGQLNKV
jgi:DNA-binding MarR family transcriptional regulator